MASPAGRPTGRNVVLLTADVVGARMAGPAIRTVELARVLASEHRVTVASPYPPDDAPTDLEVRCFGGSRELAELVDAADVTVAFAGLVRRFPVIAERARHLVVDAYDPALLEALVHHAAETPERQQAVFEDALAATLEPLRVADLVVCASRRQRDLLIGMLVALGRVNPQTVADDPTLGHLVTVVPFGVPDEPPRPAQTPPLRSPAGPFGHDDLILLWGGGIYDWLDPVTLVRALAEVDDEGVGAYFLATGHPTPDVGPMAMVDRARSTARELGLLGTRVHFGPEWVPYRERAALFLDADVGVSLHRDHIEALYAFRTRVLDYIWCGLPILCTEGDTLADEVRARGLGEVVPPDDPAALAEAIRRLADDDRRARARQALRSVEPELRWSSVAEPIVRYCRAPRVAADRSGRAFAARRAPGSTSVRRLAHRLRALAPRKDRR